MKENAYSTPGRAIKMTRILLSAVSFFISLLSFGFCLLPYGFLKSLGDHLSSDGNYKSFTPAFYASLRLPAALAGAVLLLVGIGLFLFSDKAERGILSVKSILGRTSADAKILLQDLKTLRLDWKESLPLFGLFITGLAARLLLLNRPIEYDEAYTFTQFARYPFRVIVSDYSAPNNHIFQTILVRIAYLLLGDQAWQIRLPAFLAGLFIILGVYLLGRTLYGKATGVVAAGIIAFLPDFIIRSVSARGYPLVVLMFLLCFILAGYLLRHKNLFGWCLFSLFSAVGFYSVPVMLYPFCVVFLWLLLSTAEAAPRHYSRAGWIEYLSIAAALTGGLTAFFYSPILLSPHAGLFYRQNNTLHPLAMATFLQTFPARFQALITEWQRFLPPVWTFVILLGVVLSLVWLWKNNKFKIPTQPVFLLALIIVLLIQRPDSVTRIWLWVVPLLAIWSAAGIVTSIQSLPAKRIKNLLVVILPAILIGGMAINAVSFSYTARVNHWGEDPVAEEVTQAILPHVTQNSYIVLNGCIDARYWYYFFIHGVPLSVFYKRDEPRPFDRVIAIVYASPTAGCGTEPIADTLRLFGPDPDLLELSTLKPIETVYYVTVYEVLPRH